jgi:hypothetical protein
MHTWRRWHARHRCTAHPFDNVDYSMPGLDVLPTHEFSQELVGRFMEVAGDALDLVHNPEEQTYNIEQRHREIDAVFTGILQDHTQYISYGQDQQEIDDMVNEIGKLTKEMMESLERVRAGRSKPRKTTVDSEEEDSEEDEDEEAMGDDGDNDNAGDNDDEDDDEDDDEEGKENKEDNSWIEAAIEEAKTGPRQKYADPNAAGVSSQDTSLEDAPMT